jgi:hypothetical protein
MKERQFKDEKTAVKFNNGDRYYLTDYEQVTFGQFWTVIKNSKIKRSTAYPNTSIACISWSTKNNPKA